MIAGQTRQGKIAGIYCDQPARILKVETQEWPKWATDPASRAFLSLIDPQTSTEVVVGQVTSVHHMLAMAFDDPTMDDDLRAALKATCYLHLIVRGPRPAAVVSRGARRNLGSAAAGIPMAAISRRWIA